MEEIDKHMERKTFLSTAAGIGGILAAASAALASAPMAAAPIATMVPRPGATPTPWRRGGYHSNKNIRTVRMHLEHVIDELSHDQHDYEGHRLKALNLCQQARQELLLAEQADPNK
jgi:hypothetical protein